MKKPFNFAKLILIFSMLVMGACGLMYEYVLSVLGNYLMGTSHEQIFIIIGLMLFAMGIGSLLQRAVTGHLLEVFLLLEIILGLLGGTSAISIFYAHASWESPEVILYGFAFLIGALIGMEIPILIRINRDYSDSLKTNLSEILTVDYIGSLVGAFLFTYFFLVKFSLSSIAFILGLANASLGFISLVYFRKLIAFPKVILMTFLMVISLLVIGLVKSDDWTKKIEQKYYRDAIIFSKTSKYQHIVVTKWKDRVNLYINGHLQFSSVDEEIYHELLVHVPMSLASKKKRILILGGGDGLALREVLKYQEPNEVILVDIDPLMTQTAATLPELTAINHNAFSDSRVITLPAQGLKAGQKFELMIQSQRSTKIFSNNVYPVAQVYILHLDADLFMSQINGKFDVIILDFPDPGILELSKLFSLDFYSQVRKRLNQGGVIALQATSPFFAKEAFLCIGKTLESAGFHTLPYHGTIPSFSGEWGWYLGWHKNEMNNTQMQKKIADQKEISVPTKYLTPEVMHASFIFGKGRLSSETKIEVNTKFMPKLVHYYRQSWKKWE